MLSLEKRGRKIYRENENYRKIVNLFEHPEFQEFYQEYMKDPHKLKVILLFLMTYESIKNSSNNLNPYEVLCVTKDAIENGEYRERFIESLN